MKIKKSALKIIYFTPAAIGTTIILNTYLPRIPIELVFTLCFLWIGSGLLATGRVIGSMIGLISPILLLVNMNEEYMYINPTPYSIGYMIFYTVCGCIVYYNILSDTKEEKEDMNDFFF